MKKTMVLNIPYRLLKVAHWLPVTPHLRDLAQFIVTIDTEAWAAERWLKIIAYSVGAVPPLGPLPANRPSNYQ
ncbi:hypothetical protein HZ326_8843 [Fusarium oxysporum f. sp. albedinis]|nr:hypothetical protein HZ326_8843 [Fusarium oxysporum f. sp. albedinis]